jgi:hypothetical protein
MTQNGPVGGTTIKGIETAPNSQIDDDQQGGIYLTT